MSLIFEKMAKILASIDAIGKGRKNVQQGYSFRGIDDMYNDLHKYFAAEGVFITSTILNSFREERTTKSGGSMTYSIIDFEFRFNATDGSYVATQQRGEASDSGDKSSNKAASTALKYALMQTLLIPTEEEKDTEVHSPEFAAKQPIKKVAPVLLPLAKGDANYEKVVRAIKDGFTIAQVKGKYEVSKELEAQLLEDTKQPQLAAQS